MTTPPVQSITDELIAELEKVASKATPGPRRIEFDEDSCAGAMFVCAGLEMYSGGQICRTYSDRDADFMEVASPDVLQGLITRLRAAEQDAARYRWLRTYAYGSLADWELETLWSYSDEKIDVLVDTAMERTP